MVLTTKTIGAAGDYTTLTLWEAARQTSSSSGDTEQATIIAGTAVDSFVLAGWTTGVIVEIVAQTVPVTAVAGRIDVQVGPASVLIEGIIFDQTGVGSFHPSIYSGFTQTANHALTVRKCQFINSPNIANTPLPIRVNSTQDMGGYAYDLVVENCSWFNNFNNLSLWMSPANGDFTMNVAGCSFDNSRIVLGSSGRATPLTYDINFEGCLFNMYFANFGMTGAATYTSSIIDCISSEVVASSPAFDVDTNNLYSVTFVDGTPAAGQVGWADSTVDLSLVDDANNVAISHWGDVGTELVTNGDFAADITSWTDASESPGAIAWDGVGQLELSNTNGLDTEEGIAYQAVTVVIGKTYQVSADKSAGNSIVQLGTAAGNNAYFESGNDAVDVDEFVIPTTTSLYVTVRNNNDTTAALVDNISVTEITASAGTPITDITGIHRNLPAAAGAYRRPTRVTTKTIGSAGDYTTLPLWEAARQTSSLAGDTERAEAIAGTTGLDGTTSLAGWTTGVKIEIAAQTTPVTAVIGRIDLGVGPESVLIEEIIFDMTGIGSFGSCIYTNFTQTADLTTTVRKCQFINAPDTANTAIPLRVNTAQNMAGFKLFLNVENCSWHNNFDNISIYMSPTTGTFSVKVHGCSFDTSRIFTGSSGAATPTNYVTDYEGCLFNMYYGQFDMTGNAVHTSSMIDCISNKVAQTVPAFDVDTNNLYSKTFVSGAPAVGQVGWADSTVDLSLTDDANNIAIKHWLTNTPPTEDLNENYRGSPGNAGAYELLVLLDGVVTRSWSLSHSSGARNKTFSQPYRAVLTPQDYQFGTLASVGTAHSIPVSATNNAGVLWDDHGVGEIWWERIHILPRSKIEFGSIVTYKEDEFEIFSAYRDTIVNLTVITNNLGAGSDVPTIPAPTAPLDPLMSFLDPTSTRLNEVKTKLVVLEDGVPTFDSSVDFTFDSGDMPQLLASGSRIAVWTEVWEENGFKEIWKFKTDIMPGLSGKEQRAKLRSKPRQELSTTFLLDDLGRQRAQVLLHGWSDSLFALPLWHEEAATSALVTIGDTSVTVLDSDDRDFRVGGLAIIFQDADVFDVVNITAVTSTTLSFSASPVLNGYASGVKIYPVRLAHIKGVVTGQRHKADLESFDITWAVYDNDTGAPGGDLTGWNTHNGKILLDDCNMMRGDTMPVTHNRKVTYIDNETGVMDADSRWDRNKRSTEKGFRCDTRADILTLRKLLISLGGKQTSFWLPTHANDLTAVLGLSIATSTLDIQNISFARFIAAGANPKDNIRITFTDDTSLIRGIVSSSAVSSTVERLTLDGTWPATRALGEIAQIDFLEQVRFDTDNFSFKYNRLGNATLIAPVVTVFDS